MPGRECLSDGIAKDDQWIDKAALSGAGVPQLVYPFLNRSQQLSEGKAPPVTD